MDVNVLFSKTGLFPPNEVVVCACARSRVTRITTRVMRHRYYVKSIRLTNILLHKTNIENTVNIHTNLTTYMNTTCTAFGSETYLYMKCFKPSLYVYVNIQFDIMHLCVFEKPLTKFVRAITKDACPFLRFRKSSMQIR